MGEAIRYYTVDEANRSIDELSRLFGRVMQIRTQLKAIYRALEEQSCAPTQTEIDAIYDGPRSTIDDWTKVDPEELSAAVMRDRGVFFALVETLRNHVDDIQSLGCIIKDIETGLVDWPAIRGDQPVFLCWRYGEPAVGFWHEEEAGFAGRRPISELGDDRGGTES